MENSTVYVLQDQANMDFSPAELFGSVKFLGAELSNMRTPTMRDQARLAQMAQVVREFKPDRDYVVFTGSPVVMATFAAMMGRYHGTFKTLRWDRAMEQYIPVVVDTQRLLGEDNAG